MLLKHITFDGPMTIKVRVIEIEPKWHRDINVGAETLGPQCLDPGCKGVGMNIFTLISRLMLN